jgi:hypothetical protein
MNINAHQPTKIEKNYFFKFYELFKDIRTDGRTDGFDEFSRGRVKIM